MLWWHTRETETPCNLNCGQQSFFPNLPYSTVTRNHWSRCAPSLLLSLPRVKKQCIPFPEWDTELHLPPILTLLTVGTFILPGGSISTYWQWYHLSAWAVISCLIDFCLVTPPASSLSQAPLPSLYWLIDNPIHLLQGRWQAGIWLFCVLIFTACRLAAWSLWSFAQRASVQPTPALYTWDTAHYLLLKMELLINFICQYWGAREN